MSESEAKVEAVEAVEAVGVTCVLCAEPSVVVIVVVVDGLAPPVIEAEVGAKDCDATADDGVKLTVIEGIRRKVPLLEEDAPIDKDEVGVTDFDCDKDCVELGVFDDVVVPLIVAEGVGVLVAVDELVVLPEFELLAGVFEGLEPRVIDADDENEIEEVSVTVEEAVWDEVPVPETVALAVAVTDGVFKALFVDEGVIGGDTVALNEMEGVPLAEPPILSELVGVAVIVDDRLVVVELLSLPVGDCVDVCDDVLEPVPVEELVGLFEGEFDVV